MFNSRINYINLNDKSQYIVAYNLMPSPIVCFFNDTSDILSRTPDEHDLLNY